jgi:ABC-type protease/lipase transport system fused ATPase/permease subunit
MEILFLYLFNKVSDNCKKISPNFKLNLEDKMTRITWNFNVHARIEKEKSIDGLMACHIGALFGYFFLKLIETIRIGMLKKVKHDLLDFNLSLPPI